MRKRPFAHGRLSLTMCLPQGASNALTAGLRATNGWTRPVRSRDNGFAQPQRSRGRCCPTRGRCSKRPPARLPFILLLLMLSTAAIRAQQMPRPSSVPTESGGIIEGTVTTQNATIALGGVRVSLSSEPHHRSCQRLVGSGRHVSVRGTCGRALQGGRGARRLRRAVQGRDGFVERDGPRATRSAARHGAERRRGGRGRKAWCRTPGRSPRERRSQAASSRKSGSSVDSRPRCGCWSASSKSRAASPSRAGGRARRAFSSVRGCFVDPATGLSQVRLPDDAIDSVTVLPNPYAVEYGRFSSGLVLIQTRRAADRWKTRLNSLDPSFRTKRHEPLQDHRHCLVCAAVGNRGAAHQGSFVPAGGGPVSVSHERSAQPAAGGSEDRARASARSRAWMPTCPLATCWWRPEASFRACPRSRRSAPSRRRTPRPICTAASTRCR